jgi:hypothetical protein
VGAEIDAAANATPSPAVSASVAPIAPLPTSAPAAPTSFATCSTVTFGVAPSMTIFHVCPDRPADVAPNNNIFAFSGAAQNAKIYSDTPLSSATISDDQSTAYAVTTDATGSYVTWSPTRFFSRLDVVEGTSRFSLFAFSFGGLHGTIGTPTQPNPSTGTFRSVAIDFAFPAAALGSIRIRPTLTAVSDLKAGTPTALVHPAGPAGAFLGLTIQSIGASADLTGSAIQTTAKIDLPGELGGSGITSVPFTIDPHDFSFALAGLTVPQLYGFTASIADAALVISDSSLSVTADQATLTLPKGIGGAITASTVALTVAASTTTTGRNMSAVATNFAATDQTLTLGTVATISNVQVSASSFSSAKSGLRVQGLKVQGTITFSDLVDAGLTATVNDLEFNGSAISQASVNLVNKASLARLGHVLGFAGTVSTLGITYDPSAGIEFVVAGTITTPQWLGNTSIAFGNLKVKGNGHELDGIPTMSFTKPIQVSSLSVTITGTAANNCGASGIALVENPTTHLVAVYLCGSIEWPKALSNVGTTQPAVTFTDMNFGPDLFTFGDLAFTGNISASFGGYLEINVTSISLNPNSPASGVSIGGNGTFTDPVANGVLKSGSFNFAGNLQKAYSFTLSDPGVIVDTTLGPAKIQVSDLQLTFAPQGTSQTQQVLFNFVADYTPYGLGAQGTQIGFTLSETPPPNSKLTITTQGPIKTYVNWSQALLAVLGFLVGHVIR